MAKSLFEELGGKYERQGDYLIPCLTVPAEHGRRVGMSASRNASTGRNVGWRRVHLWISPPFFRMACWAL